MSMYASPIHGQSLDVTVVGCTKLKDTEWISRQDPYVCLEYGSVKFRTRTCTDGGKNPTFQERFIFTLVEGLRDLSVFVWNSNTITVDDFIGSGKIHLSTVLREGYDDSSWPLLTKTGRYAGEVRVILHYRNAANSMTGFAPPPHAPLLSSLIPSTVPAHAASPPPPLPGHSPYCPCPPGAGFYAPYPASYTQAQPPPSTVYPPRPPPPPPHYMTPGSYPAPYPPGPY